jgi:hypothetical protein
MALSASGKLVLFFSIITITFMILNLVQVVQLEKDQGSDAGIVLDKVFSSFFLVFAIILLILMGIRGVCDLKIGNPTVRTICFGLEKITSMKYFPVLTMLNGAFRK